MALRLFRCDSCGHRMRFKGGHCGRCFAEKQPHQKPFSSVALMAGVVAVLLVGASMMAL